MLPMYSCAGVDIRALPSASIGWDSNHVAYLLGVLALGVWFTAPARENC